MVRVSQWVGSHASAPGWNVEVNRVGRKGRRNGEEESIQGRTRGLNELAKDETVYDPARKKQ